MTTGEDKYAWIGDVDVERILGDARPRTVEKLLEKKNPVWAALYLAWLRRFDTNNVGAFDEVCKAGGRPRLQGRAAYDRSIAALGKNFDKFVDVVGDIKQALDSRTGLARRLGRAADKAASGVKQATQSDTATQAAGPSAARRVDPAAGRSTQRPTQQPQRSPAQAAPPLPPRPDARLGAYANQTAAAALPLAAYANLAYYVQVLDWVRQRWYPLGGSLGQHTAYVYTLHDEIVRYRAAVEQAAIAVQQRSPGANDRQVVELVYELRRCVHALASYVDLVYYTLGLPAPHVAIAEVYDELVRQQAHVLCEAIRPRLYDIANGLLTMYGYGAGVVAAGTQLIGTVDPAYGQDKLQPWQEHLTAYYSEAEALKDKLAVAVDDEAEAGEEQQKREDELSKTFFGVPVKELPAYG
jgi:hypothetical protein